MNWFYKRAAARRVFPRETDRRQGPWDSVSSPSTRLVATDSPFVITGLASVVSPSESSETRLSPSVLVIEDDEDTRLLLGEHLRLEGFPVSEFDSAEAALDALPGLLKRRPAILLTDVSLAGMNGFDVARRVRGQEDDHSVAIVAITGRTAWELGQDRELFDSVLTKPVNTERLIAVLRTLAENLEHRTV